MSESGDSGRNGGDDTLAGQLLHESIQKLGFIDYDFGREFTGP